MTGSVTLASFLGYYDFKEWAAIWLPIILMIGCSSCWSWRCGCMPPRRSRSRSSRRPRRRSPGTRSPASTRPSTSCARSSSSCAIPKRFKRARRDASRGASCCTARPAPARRCSPRPSRTSRARTSSRSRRPRSSRCSPASAPLASAASSGGAQERARDRLHRRARRGRRPPRRRHLRREGPDAQPAARRDGRLRRERRRRRDRRLQPAREARPGAAAPRPLRPPDLRRAARPSAAASGSSRSTRATSRSRRASTSRSSPGRRAASRAPTSRTSATRRRSSRRAAARLLIGAGDFDAALERVIAGMQSRRELNEHEKRVVAYHEAGHALCARAAAERRPGPPHLDRPARPRARLHAQPARTRTATSRRARS